MDMELKPEIIPGSRLAPGLRSAIHGLCNRAYEEDLEPLFDTFEEPVHVLGWLGDRLVSHAMGVTRWLQRGDMPLLRTAYIEMVATEPEFQGRGFATQVMQHLADAITDFDLGGLCPADTSVYARLGWEFWRGPLFIRGESGLLPTPEEQVMVLRLPKTPPLDLDQPLSAEWRPGELW